MAVRQPVITRPADNVLVITWSGLAAGDNGAPVLLPHASDKSWHVTRESGTAGVVQPKGHNRDVSGGTVDLTNDPILADLQGTAIAGTFNTIEQIVENPLFIYPHATAQDGTMSARMVVKGDRV